jgi:hypothetical protein
VFCAGVAVGSFTGGCLVRRLCRMEGHWHARRGD